jgi:SAM-dependent methyltransferase
VVTETRGRPLVDREHLQKVAYADSRKLRDRISIHGYAQETKPFMATVLEQCDWPDGARVLDVGCGPGLYLRALAQQHGVRAVGVDLSTGMAREARIHAPAAAADAARLPFPDGGFDRVLAAHMLYHCPDVEATVAELRRVLRPDGVALVTVSSAESLAELRDLVRSVIGVDLLRGIARVSLENGEPQLRSAFSHVTTVRHPAELVLPDPAPALAFVRSTMSWAGTPDPDEAAAEIERRIAEVIARDGAFHTSVVGGIFVCR